MQAAFCYRKIGVEEAIPGILHKRKELVTITLKIIEENTADAAHFRTVSKSEIFIAPFLESWVELWIVPVARRSDRSMKMRRIFCIGITRCEIGASAEPLCCAFFKISEIRMHGRNHWAPRVKDERDSGGEELRSCTEGNFGREILGQVSLHGRKINPGFLEHPAVFEHTRASAATTFALPCVFTKWIAVEVLDGTRHAVLQLLEKVFGFLRPIHIHGMGDYIQFTHDLLINRRRRLHQVLTG